MNWILTLPNERIVFDVDEPIPCMIVPQRRGELESFQPLVRNIANNPEDSRPYAQRSLDQTQFLADLKVLGLEAVKQECEKLPPWSVTKQCHGSRTSDQAQTAGIR